MGGSLGFAPKAALQDLGLPLWGPGMDGGDAVAWVTGVLAAPGTQGSWRLGQQEVQCSRRVWQPVWANTLQYCCLENPLSDRESCQATVYRIAKSRTWPKWPCAHRCKTFFCLWQLCPSESWAWRWRSSLACRDPGGAKCVGTQTASAAGVMALTESFLKPLEAGDQKASLANLSLKLLLFRHLEHSLPGVLLP